ncbi:MAG: DUF1499 domain-containing protein [Rhodospirillaceae bacterium]
MTTMEMREMGERKPASRLLTAVTFVSIGCAVAAALAGFGHRWGWWDYRNGFAILRWAVYVAAGAGIVSLIAFIAATVQKHGANALLGLTGAVVAAAVVLPAWQLQRIGSTVPRIHDITTDLDNPPAFVAIVPLRKDAPNPATYDGAKTAAEQKIAYADLHGVQLAMPPAQAYQRALDTARSMGWEIVADVPSEGRIEASDRTFWFGFIDDVVIRVAAAGTGSRVDVRSKSRVGRNDFGTNAKRIRAYTRKLEAAR